MDLKKLDTVAGANKGAELTVLTPEGDRTDITIRVVGMDSDIYRKAARVKNDKRLKKLQKRGRQNMTTAELEDEATALLTDCTLDWANIEEGGKALECSRENVERIYRDFPDIRRQVDKFIAEPAYFLG